MQVTETLSEGLRRAYTVVVPAAELESKRAAKLAEIGRTIKLPGFRPGKVPANLVRQRFGGSVMAEVMQDALTGATDEMIAERQLRPVGQPKVDLLAVPNIDATTSSDLEFKVELEVLPEIATPDLSTLSLVRRRAVPAPAVVDQFLEQLTAKNAELVALEEDRGAAAGDVLTVDFTGYVDDTPFQGGAGTDVNVEVGGSGFIPGFAEQMEGMRPGDTRSIEVIFPAAYQAAELAGKPARFEVVAKDLKRKVPAVLDDALGEKLGYENLEKLREAVVGQFQRDYDQAARMRTKRELLDALAERADFPAPQGLVDAEFNAIWQRVEQDIKSGQADADDAGKDIATLRTEYHAIAVRRVRLGLLLSEIGRSAGVQVTQQEISQALRNEASRYPGQEVQVIEFFRKNAQALEQLRGPIFEDKVVDYILELAQVEDRLVSVEELEAEPELPAAIAAPAMASAPAPESAPAAEAAPEPDAPEPDAPSAEG